MAETIPNLFAPQPTGSSSASAEWKPPEHTSQAHQDPNRSAWISARAKLVFGSYRRDDFADPDSFLLQLGMVLERYPDDVIEGATSPITGIQRKSKFPPNMAEVVDVCDQAMAVAARLERYRKMGPTVFRRQPREPQHRANVFVAAGHALYATMVERARGADPLDYRYEREPAGIWVALGWLDDPAAGASPKGFRRFTKADLEAIYQRSDEAKAAAE